VVIVSSYGAFMLMHERTGESRKGEDGGYVCVFIYYYEERDWRDSEVGEDNVFFLYNIILKEETDRDRRWEETVFTFMHILY